MKKTRLKSIILSLVTLVAVSACSNTSIKTPYLYGFDEAKKPTTEISYKQAQEIGKTIVENSEALLEKMENAEVSFGVSIIYQTEHITFSDETTDLYEQHAYNAKTNTKYRLSQEIDERTIVTNEEFIVQKEENENKLIMTSYNKSDETYYYIRSTNKNYISDSCKREFEQNLRESFFLVNSLVDGTLDGGEYKFYSDKKGQLMIKYFSNIIIGFAYYEDFNIKEQQYKGKYDNALKKVVYYPYANIKMPNVESYTEKKLI